MLGQLTTVMNESTDDTYNKLADAKKAIAAGHGPASFDAMLPGYAGSGGFGRGATLNSHTEQLKHYSGWVFSSIRPTAQRIARQPIRIARAIAKPRRMRDFPTKKKFFRWAKQQLNLKLRLPHWLKDYADNLEVLEWHPFLDSINRPNPLMTRWSLMYVSIASLKLTAKCHWWIHDNDGDGRLNIWYIPSSWITPLHEDGQLYNDWELRPGGKGMPIRVPAHEIVYFSYPDPSNPLGAMGPLQAAARAVVADEAITDAQRRGFINGIFPGYAVIVGRNPDITGKPGDRPMMTKNQKTQIMTAIKQAYRGVAAHDEPIILDALIEDIKKVSNTNREMDYMNSGKQTKERITQAFGTNPIVMGQVESVNRASSVAAEEHWLDNTVNPDIELMSQIITIFVCPLWCGKDERICAYIEEAKAYDPELSLRKQDLLMKWGAMTVNQLRKEMGMPPLPPHLGEVVFWGGMPVPVDEAEFEEMMAAPEIEEEEEEDDSAAIDDEGKEDEGKEGEKTGKKLLALAHARDWPYGGK